MAPSARGGVKKALGVLEEAVGPSVGERVAADAFSKPSGSGATDSDDDFEEPMKAVLASVSGDELGAGGAGASVASRLGCVGVSVSRTSTVELSLRPKRYGRLAAVNSPAEVQTRYLTVFFGPDPGRGFIRNSPAGEAWCNTKKTSFFVI